jgi:hypothetical protein
MVAFTFIGQINWWFGMSALYFGAVCIPMPERSLVMRRRPILIFSICLLGAILLAAGGCTPGPAAISQVVTVVQTIPVEVTRLVEIVSTVEVDREVIVTQIVEIPVTVTPTNTLEATLTPEATATLIPGPTFTEGAFVPADYDPNNKKPGLAPLKVINETDDRLTVAISGARAFTIVLNGNDSTIEIVPEGEFSYTVWRNEQIAYQGSFRVTNPDKHELVLREDKAVFRVP